MQRSLVVGLLSLLLAGPIAAQKVLFDARHNQTAGEADWIVDADSSQLRFRNFQCSSGTSQHHSGQRFPTPPQSGIGPDTPETFWEGGISAWAVALAKDALNAARGRSWQIEQYAWDAPPMTFGNAANPQDLANYDVLILCEPNLPYTDGEAAAILRFVEEGGGLFLIADHETSDRECSGGPGGEKEDSPFLLNRLMGTRVATSPAPPYFDPSDPDNDFGVFGIWFHENGNDDPNDDENGDFDWFDEGVNSNVTSDPTDPVVRGPFGDGRGGLGLFGSTQISLSTDPDKGNPTARAHVWRNGQGQAPDGRGVSTRVTFATARFGRGRVAAVGDSSPADDDTGQGRLHPGWDKASGGVANHVLFLNATEWLAGAEQDVAAPVIAGGPQATPADCHARVLWATDEPALGSVDWGESAALLPHHAAGSGARREHALDLAPLDPATEYHFQVAATDLAGNGPTRSAVLRFTTAAAAAPRLTAGPAVEAVTDRSATVVWQTDEPATSVVRFGVQSGAGALDRTERRDGAPALEHRLTLQGLEPATAYQLQVESADGCGEMTGAAGAFTTAARPSTRDLAGWRLLSDHPQFAYTFPAGTEIPAGGFVVVGREGNRAGFEAVWGPLPAGVVYLDSGNRILVNGTARPYRLLDAAGQPADGPTAEVKSGQSRHRKDGCGTAATAWEQRAAAAGDPGRGAPPACGAGVILTELADADDFHHEFVEIHFDGGP